MLHYVFIQTQCVGEWKRTLYAVWSAHGLEGASQSQHWLISVWCPLFKMVCPWRKKLTFVYPNIPSAIRLMPHGNGLSVSEPPDNFAMYSDDEDSLSSNSEEQQPSASRDANYLPSIDSSNHKITEGELSDLTRNLEIPKNKAALLASSLQQLNLLNHSPTAY